MGLVVLLLSAILNAYACCQLKETNGVVKCLPSSCKGNSTLDLNFKCTKTVKSMDFSNLERVNSVDLKECPHADWSKLHTADTIIIQNLHGTSVTFPALKSCKAWFLAGLPEATEVALPVLEEIYEFTLQLCAKLKSLTLPSLKKISGGWICSSNPILETVSLPVLVSGYWLSAQNNNEWTSFNAPMLKNVSLIGFEQNLVLPKVVFPKLEWATKIKFSDNPHLTELSFPVLTESNITIQPNTKLSKVHLPKLHKSGGMAISKTADNLCVDLSCFEQAPSFFQVFINGTQRDAPICNKTVWKFGCGR